MMKFFKGLYVQVITAIIIGILLGYFYPSFAVELKPFGDGFIKLVKMMIGPVIFCTIVTGIAGMQDTKKVGRVGIKALIYFEIVSTLALIIGLVVINILKPGVGMNVDPASLDIKSVETYLSQGKSSTLHEHHTRKHCKCALQRQFASDLVFLGAVWLCIIKNW
jgi:aerobic C4-dicarboxylate transport protein